MKVVPTERAMGLVTILSGLAIPIGILIGAGPFGSVSQVVSCFNAILWIINPIGFWLFQNVEGLFYSIASFIGGTMVSAYFWGMIDTLVFQRQGGDDQKS